MAPKKTTITRREFIRDASVATLGGSLLLGSPEAVLGQAEKTAEKAAEAPPPEPLAEVVLVRDPQVLDAEGQPRRAVVQEMLDRAVTHLTRQDEAAQAWKKLFRPTDVVGIKSNVWRHINTTAAVEQSLKASVESAGVKPENIGIGDRGIIGQRHFDEATALINARPMRTHHWSGLGTLIKNYITFVDDPYNYHEEACSRLGEIWTKGDRRRKTRLNVLVMFTPQFHTSGPHGFSPRHVRKYHGLLVGFDPVAVDTVGALVVQGMRNDFFQEERPLNPSARHIRVADTKYKVGCSDPERIRLVKFGYDEDSYV